MTPEEYEMLASDWETGGGVHEALIEAACDVRRLQKQVERLTENSEFMCPEGEAELTALRADAERLDWLENKDNELFRRNHPINRAAIDAARS